VLGSAVDDEVGDRGDGRYLEDWHDAEHAGRPARWSRSRSRLLLPVIPGKRYTLTLEGNIPPPAISAEAGLYADGKQIAPLKSGSLLTATVPSARAESVEIGFGASFFQLFLFDQAAELADLFADSADALGDGFEFEGELAALSAEGFDLRVRVGDLGFEAAGFAIGSGEAFFGLRELVAQARGGRNGVENGDARFFLLALDLGEAGGSGSGVLLAEGEIVFRAGEVGGGGFQNLAVGFAFGFERGQAMARLG